MSIRLVILLLSLALYTKAQDFIDLALFPEDIRISGSEPMSGIGHRVYAGDVNGDGYPDILAAGTATETFYTGGGAAFLILGSANPKRFMSTDDQTGITTFWGNGPQEYTGEEPELFDFNGDGLADLFINAPQWNYIPKSSEGRGKIYYFPGRPAWPREVFLEDHPQGKGYSTLWGQYPRSYFGFLSRHGDLNGDGIEDLIVASGRGRQDVPLPNQGTIYIVWGGQNPGSGLIEELGLKISKVFLPYSISYPSLNIDSGDADGDGYDDLFVGVGATFDSLLANGRIYIVWGQQDFPQNIELESAFHLDQVTVISSDRERSQIGTRIYVGNFNNNGIPDIVTPHYDYSKWEPPPNDSFRRLTKYVHIFYDLFMKRQKVIQFFDPALERTILEDQSTNQEIGSTIDFADWDHDGFDDIVLGNYRAGRNTKDKALEGCVYVLYGNQAFADTVIVRPPGTEYRMTTIYGGSYASWFGSWVTVNDMNQDGMDDLILGSWGATTSAGDSGGEVYVIYNKKTDRHTTAPESFNLNSPYPNPFKKQTAFQFYLKKRSSVDVNIYDVTGRMARNIMSGVFSEGRYWGRWDGLDEQNIRRASGVYFVVVHADGQTMARKIVFLPD